MIDGIGYSLLNHVFPANMTGNLVITSIAPVSETIPLAPGPALAIAAFLAGAWLAGRVLRLHRAPTGWSKRAAASFALVSVVVAGSGWWLAAANTDGDPAPLTLAKIAALLGGAMGIQAAAARKVGLPELNTVVVTLPLAALGLDGGRSGQRRLQAHRALSVLSIAAGALIGGLCTRPWDGLSLFVPAGILMLVAIAGVWRPWKRGAQAF